MKSLLSYLAGLIIPVIATAQVAGPLHPGSLHNEPLGGSSRQWINTGNAAQSDNLYASFGNIEDKTGAYTDNLVATNFGFMIPQGAIILGIVVEIEKSDPNSLTGDYNVRIIKDGEITQTEFAKESSYPSQDNYEAYGSSTNLWGESWSYKHIVNNNFGVAISAKRIADDGVTAGRIDDIRITVYYNFSTLPLTLLSFNAVKNEQSVMLSWKTAEESGMQKFRLERSSNGSLFQTIAEIPALNQPTADYAWLDANSLRGVSFYRLKMEGVADYQEYSKTVSVRTDRPTQFFLYPSPWKIENELNITNDDNEKLTVCFYSIGGIPLSTALTETKLVPTETLTSRKGLLYYKIFDSKKNILGSGSLLILQ